MSSPVTPAGASSEDARARVLEGLAERHHLVFSGERSRHVFAIDGAVHDRARGGDAERADLDPLVHQLAHLLDILGVGWLVHRAAFPHHVRAYRPVWHLGADIDRLWQRVDVVEILGEGLPVPLHPSGKGCPRDVLDALHEPDQPIVAVGGAWCEAHAAVPDHDRGDPVPTGRREQRIPRDLSVEVRVDVHEAGSDDQSRGIDCLSAISFDPSDGNDRAIINGHIALESGRARAVYYGAVPNNEVVQSSRSWATARVATV